jgi:D-lactate dehydrogenase
VSTALLAPDPRRTAPEAAPTDDRAAAWVAGGTPEPLRAQLLQTIAAERLALRAIDLVRYASDASPYRLMPQAVALPRDCEEVARLFALARRTRTPIVFRAGGTSLNGQGQTDGILLDVRRHWQRATVEDGGARVRTQPGAVLGHINRRLARHGRRLGPDPASTDIACMGGVIANNSGGMRCGVTADTYSTLRSLRFVLANGASIDTAEADAPARFRALAPELASGLERLRDELRADAEMSARVRRKFEIKNTTGYRLCALLDADEPLEIFKRLLVGSEGTLAFVAEAVLDTVPLGRHTALCLAHFADVDRAVASVPKLVAAGATATELMVAPTLIAAAWNMPGTPEAWKQLDPASAALLVELRAEEADALAEIEREALALLAVAAPLQPPSFSRDAHQIEMLWRVREGMQGLLAAMRAPGVTMIIEDVCVRPERIAEAARDLQALLGEHGFLQGVAGHASAGNLHFLLTPNFTNEADVGRYETFMEALVELIVGKYDGSLKAEHGTGVNMAPFVQREWGPRATEMMWRIKQLADPDGVLAPGVVLSRERAHLRNLKSVPTIEPVATQCIECGFCEPACPSRDLTTTPRQRIAIRREMVRQPPGSPVLDALLEQYEYDAIETCAADGTCSLACPVGIDTGALVKELRARERTPRQERAGVELARRWKSVERSARAALALGRRGGRAPTTLGSLARRAISHELLPAWVEPMPPPAPPLPVGAQPAGAAAVYFPSCVNRIFAATPPLAVDRVAEAGADPELPAALVALSARAGAPLWIPPDVAGLCCATPWSSKGYRAGHAEMAAHTAAAILRWTEGGRLPLVCDASSCTLALVAELPAAVDDDTRERLQRVEVHDSIAWARERLLPALQVRSRARSVAVHTPCAALHLGLREPLLELAGALADEVLVASAPTCCGMAGDRGLLHPELPAAALAPMARELREGDPEACVCSNRTCEMGLAQATGLPFGSLVGLLERATRAD